MRTLTSSSEIILRKPNELKKLENLITCTNLEHS